jgi:adenylosuccinate synthase
VEKLLLLSGASGAGKSSVAKVLEDAFQFKRISSSGYLRTYGIAHKVGGEKQQLQDLGDRLDLETGYLWIVTDVAIPSISASPEYKHWLLDAVRKPRQVEHFKNQFGHTVRHVHLSAPNEILQQRYNSRAKPSDTPYEDVIRHPNEITARSLGNIADCTIDTSQLSPEDIAQHVLKLWGEQP